MKKKEKKTIEYKSRFSKADSIIKKKNILRALKSIRFQVQSLADNAVKEPKKKITGRSEKKPSKSKKKKSFNFYL